MLRVDGGVCLAFGETHFNMLCGVVVVCPMHGVILIFARVVAKSFSTLHSSSMRWGVASVFMV